MKNKLTKVEFLSVSLMLFGMFFGSGNLIFPPMLGNMAGTSLFPGLLGFATTSVVFPVLGILAIAKTNGVENLGRRVGATFAMIYTAVIFLAMGPGIAIPRNGSLAFEMSVVPCLSEDSNLVIWRFVYTLVFFGIAYYLCLTPSKLVSRMGKILTPMLLTLILIFFLGSVFKLPVDIARPHEDYANPFLTGFLKGYDTMDALASLNFGLVVALTIRNFKVNDDKKVIGYASKAGLLAGLLLFAVYAMLAYIGQISSVRYEGASNGGSLLFEITNQVFGPFGAVILILIFTLACLTTVIGLITSVSNFFTDFTGGRVPYKVWTTTFTLISLALANFGLENILKFSVPILVSIYPVAIVLIVMALLQDLLNFDNLAYKSTVYVTLFISILQALKVAKIQLPLVHDMVSKLPLASNGLEWVLPFILTLVLSTLLSKVVGRPNIKEKVRNNI